MQKRHCCDTNDLFLFIFFFFSPFTEPLYQKKTFANHSQNTISKWKLSNSFRKYSFLRYISPSSTINWFVSLNFDNLFMISVSVFPPWQFTARIARWPCFSSVQWKKPYWLWWKCTTISSPIRIIYALVFPNQISRMNWKGETKI